jgi:DNA-binding NtrC family response regulator
VSNTFLLISDQEEIHSFDNLVKALADLGELQFLPEKEALQISLGLKYDIVIIDAAILDNKMLLISQIRERQPKTRIIVLTASPTWRRAREALKAGAMDYLSKTMSEREYFQAFKDILDRTLSL